MIKANELRVGSLLHYLTAEGDIFPSKIDWRDLKWIQRDENGFNAVHDPIVLTEQWLKDFGFIEIKKAVNENGYEIINDCPSKHIYIRTFCEPSIFGFFTFFNHSECNQEEIQFIKKVEFVHQLQNLYFALTGEELTLNK